MKHEKLVDRVKRAWNVFVGKESPKSPTDLGPSSYYRLYPIRSYKRKDTSIVTSVLNRIAVDAASIKIVHAQKDANDRYADTIPSGLNDVLTINANIDQTGFVFKHDIFMSLFDEGAIAIVPTFIDPDEPEAKGIVSCRTAKITQWYPKYVRVLLYDEDTGTKKEITLPKDYVCIVENPFYAVMNAPNSLASRLMRKLQLLDAIDEQIGGGKLDLIIQLPYDLRGSGKREQANIRRKDIEDQLKDEKYGIAYISSTEKVIQLNRPVENNLLSQIEYMTKVLYAQLGVTEEIMNQTANEQTMINYYNRTIEPVLQVTTEGMTRSFISKEDRDSGEEVMFFRDPFKLVPVAQLAEISDKLTRNEIASSNEIRTLIGWKPSDNPRADELRNANLNHPDEMMEYPDQTMLEKTEEEKKS